MLRVFSAFDSLGVVEMSLKELKVPYKLVGTSLPSENDERVYDLIHGKTNHLGVIHKIDTKDIPSHDLLFYRLYLKDIMSLVHKVPKSTRTLHKRNLLLSYERIIRDKKPYMAVMEVPMLKTNRKFNRYLKTWLKILDEIGYKNKIIGVNSKWYGTPQARHRTFIISTIDRYFEYQEPEGHNILYSLQDVLDSRCLRKYYLTKERIEVLTRNIEYELNPNKIMQVMRLSTASIKNPNIYRVYHPLGLAPSLNSMNGGGRTPYVILNMTEIRNKRFVLPKKPIIRKLTPKECWRLMTFDEKIYRKLNQFSDLTKYKLIGDSMVKNVVTAVLKNLFVEENTMYSLFLEMEQEHSVLTKNKIQSKRKRRKK